MGKGNEGGFAVDDVTIYQGSCESECSFVHSSLSGKYLIKSCQHLEELSKTGFNTFQSDMYQQVMTTTSQQCLPSQLQQQQSRQPQQQQRHWLLLTLSLVVTLRMAQAVSGHQRSSPGRSQVEEREDHPLIIQHTMVRHRSRIL